MKKIKINPKHIQKIINGNYDNNLSQIPENFNWKNSTELQDCFLKCESLSNLPLNMRGDENTCKIVKAEDMSLMQLKFCAEKDLLYEYPLIGLAGLINPDMTEIFNSLQ